MYCELVGIGDIMRSVIIHIFMSILFINSRINTGHETARENRLPRVIMRDAGTSHPHPHTYLHERVTNDHALLFRVNGFIEATTDDRSGLVVSGVRGQHCCGIVELAGGILAWRGGERGLSRVGGALWWGYRTGGRRPGLEGGERVLSRVGGGTVVGL